ncbi:unnamed protein product [Lactuca virosa]|uniref:DUF7733 domain-containing protein n=1 Tax=Lactuca virosa TaxID=75947 RepID=A0AAU9LK47_9ASTR|nr:unnamed protein product [Lactuca virosa]
MSGVSLAVAPRPDCDQNPPNNHRQDQTAGAVEDVMESLRMIDLQLVAFITVFSASGLVPLFDLLFPAITSAYLLLLSQLVSRSTPPPPLQKSDYFSQVDPLDFM